MSKYGTHSIKIKDLGRVITGSTPPTKQKEYYGNDYQFIKPSDIIPGVRRVIKTETMLSSQGYEYQIKKVVPRNSTCVVCIGTIGKICLVSKPSFTNQQINSVIVDEEKYDPIYVFYLLKTSSEKVKKVEGGSASGRDHVRKSIFEDIEIEVHPLATQHKIAAILSAFDDLIENNTRRNQILEEMAHAIYREWFVHFHFPGHENVRMVESGTEFGQVPIGWEVKTLTDICKLRRDKFIEDEHSDIPLLNMARMLQKTLSVNEMGRPEELTTSRIVFNEHDVLFGSIRSYLHKVALAPCKGVTNTSVLVIRSSQEKYKSFLPVLLSSTDIIRWTDQHSTGTKMPVIKWDAFKNLPVLIPDDSYLYHFNDIVNPMLDTIKKAFIRNKNLRQIRNMLLPKLVSGQIDVSEIDIQVA